MVPAEMFDHYPRTAHMFKTSARALWSGLSFLSDV